MKKRPSGSTKRRFVAITSGVGSRKRRVVDRDAVAPCPRARPLVAPWSHVVAGADHPPWPRHFVDTLRASLLQLKEKFGDKIRLLMWSDCAGKCTEKYAWGKLADELMQTLGIAIEFELYGACDSTRHCKDFVISNYDPSHFADDIFRRNFLEASFQCTKCVRMCSLPMTGIDIYCCCFPCGPWSKLGNRMGLDDPDANVCWQAIRTINCCFTWRM